ncbi:uncharacterized protein I206_103652 [Kwoniella pini CBS 10737]|uniref:Uncharacterized protein n=1 Tax=Kwoniella pini CBS 10737 TaxID=1296096 RepID=A0A1B9I9L2_9TREE|nr:uncharacterized protein I206_01345 [Kwoniella pini CBS 10737]OCF52061.1 hypothetical protein I206_01345 [Kwoniella pini CBS 10737]
MSNNNYYAGRHGQNRSYSHPSSADDRAHLVSQAGSFGSPQNSSNAGGYDGQDTVMGNAGEEDILSGIGTDPNINSGNDFTYQGDTSTSQTPFSSHNPRTGHEQVQSSFEFFHPEKMMELNDSQAERQRLGLDDGWDTRSFKDQGNNSPRSTQAGDDPGDGDRTPTGTQPTGGSIQSTEELQDLFDSVARRRRAKKRKGGPGPSNAPRPA